MRLGIVIGPRTRTRTFLAVGQALASITYQMEGVSDVLVVGDGFDSITRRVVAAYADNYGLPCRYVATERTNDGGAAQVNYGLQQVRGDFVLWIWDDMILAPRAVSEIQAVATDKPLLGRVKTAKYGLLWQRPDTTTYLHPSCLVTPIRQAKIGWMPEQCYLHKTLRRYDSWAWTNKVWAIEAPTWSILPLAQVQHREGWKWVFDNGAALQMSKDPDSDRMFARVLGDDLAREQLIEIVQFAMFACQGNDCWFQHVETPLLRSALIECNFKEHTLTEYTHDWAPDFWPPVEPFTELLDANGDHVPDYRDEWGGPT